jgi:ABC-type uncharacterized transport system ATPase subunit
LKLRQLHLLVALDGGNDHIRGHEPVQTVEHGRRQRPCRRAELKAALLSKPRLWLIDEPAGTPA